MDIRNIQTFLQVVKWESFTTAAKEMNYAQSTVTAQIQQLEKELGFPLFDRIGRHITLTPLGVEFISHADDILHIWFQANSLGKSVADMSGVLRIGVLESLLYGMLLDVLPIFKEKYKNVDIQITMGQTTELVSLLKQNRVDLICIIGYLNADAELVRVYERKENLIFVAAPTNRLADKKNISLVELFENNIVTTEHSGFIYTRLSKFASNQGLTLKHSVVANSTVAVAELVARGMGVCLLPEYAVAGLIKRGKLVELNVAAEPQYCWSQVLYHSNKWIVPFVDGFIQILGKVRPESNY